MKVGSIGYSCASGLGHLNKWFFDHKAVDDVFVVEHPRYPSHPEWFPGMPRMSLRNSYLGDAVREWIEGAKINVLLCYETPFRWDVLPWCRQNNVRTACMPMHEWYPTGQFGAFDLYLCPSALDFEIFAPNFEKDHWRAEQVTIPVDPSTWRRRTMARRFLHNAGHVGAREHKGTRTLLEAMRYVTKPVDLTVRGQGRDLERIVQDFVGEFGRGPLPPKFSIERKVVDGVQKVTYEIGDLPYEGRFDGFDVYVAPEKLNGCSLPLQEARAAGMLVCTTDRHPTNKWLPPGQWMIPPEGYVKARIAEQYVEFDEAQVSPRQVAATLDWLWDTDISAYSDSGLEWANENSWDAWVPRYQKMLEDLL